MPPPTDLPIHSFPNAKKASGIASVSASDAVQVALCFGWIDGQANSFDANWYLTRYTPRRPKSIWSQKNVDTVTRLLEQGEEAPFRMRPAGIAAVEAAKADGRWARAYAGPAKMTVPDDFAAALAEMPRAKEGFEVLSKTERYTLLMKLYTGAERTRETRIAGLVQKLAEGKLSSTTKGNAVKKTTVKRTQVKNAATKKAAVNKRKAALKDGDEGIPTRAKTRRTGLRGNS